MTSTQLLKGLALSVLLAVMAVAARADSGVGDDRHLALEESSPAADSTVTEAPKQIRLLFTLAPKVGATSVRLMTADSTLIATQKPAEAPGDGTVVLTTLDKPLSPGSYIVFWRTLADDGHAVSGDFSFGFQPAIARVP
jgi:methionine-rich copper-binding protein CopC